MYRFRSYCQFFNLQKEKKKKSNNPVKQTTPKTGILHEPTTQGRRSQRRNKKKKKERVARESFPRSANDISHLRSHGPVPLELQIYLVPRSFLSLHLPSPPRTKERREDWRGCRRPLRKIDSCFERETKRARREATRREDGRRVGIEREARAPRFRRLVASGYFRATRK